MEQQLKLFRATLSRNKVLMEVMDRAAVLELPGWYLTAGCLFQTIWNIRTGQPPTYGIKDYDLFHFDDSDLSWAAEDTASTVISPATPATPVTPRSPTPSARRSEDQT